MSPITKEFTKEQLQQIIETDHVQCGEASSLARIALASLEAKSRKLFTCSGCGAEGLDEPLESKCHCNEDGAHWVESVVYTAPPAPVSVPEPIKRNDADGWWMYKGRRVGGGCAEWYNRALDDCRAAMLQGAEPVTPAYKSPDDFDFDRFNDVVWLEAVASNPHMHSLTTSTIAMVALELNRKLADCNSPVIANGWVACSERMPDDDDFVYIWPRPDFGVELHVGQYCECHPKGDGWYAQVYEQNYGIEWCPITVTHWMPLPAAPQQGA